MPRNLDHFGFARIEFGTPTAVLCKLEASAIWGLEHVLVVLEEGQTQLRFLYVGQCEFSLYRINQQMHRARLEAVFPNRAIMQEGVQAWVDFQHPTTRCDVMMEMMEGLTAQMWLETA